MSQNPVQSKDLWIRALFMILYCVIFYIIWFIVITLAVLQFLSSIIFKSPNRNLEIFGQSLSLYTHEIIRFISYNTDKKPFPFDSWPTDKSIQQ